MSQKEGNVVIISASVRPKIKQMLDEAKLKTGRSKSVIVSDLVSKYLDLVVNDGDEVPVILRIPASLKGKSDELRKWLDARSDAVVKALS